MKSNVLKVVMGLFFALVFGLTGCGGGGSGGETAIPSGDTSVSKYAGSYSGTYSGSDSGTWSITANSAGVVTGSAYSSVYKTTDAISGSIDSGGALNATIGISSDGATFSGTTDANGVLAGTWKNTKYNQTGAFTGSKTTPVVTPSNTAPTVTTFAIPATSTSLTVSITTLTATDDAAVTGFMVTESSTPPSASATGWTSTKPTSFTFTSAGSKTLYAWAKDANGQVSASKSASVTITTIPTPSTMADIAGTWDFETSSGYKGTFTVDYKGTISNFTISADVPTSCFVWTMNGGGASCGNGPNQSVVVTTDSITTSSDFNFSSSKSSGYDSLTMRGVFNSLATVSGTYTASYSHNSNSSTGGYDYTGSVNGNWTATKLGYQPGIDSASQTAYAIMASSGNTPTTLAQTLGNSSPEVQDYLLQEIMSKGYGANDLATIFSGQSVRVIQVFLEIGENANPPQSFRDAFIAMTASGAANVLEAVKERLSQDAATPTTVSNFTNLFSKITLTGGGDFNVTALGANSTGYINSINTMISDSQFKSTMRSWYNAVRYDNNGNYVYLQNVLGMFSALSGF